MLKQVWEYLSKHTKPIVWSFVSISVMYALKSCVYDRLTPVTLVQKMISEGKFSRLITGNLWMIGYLKDQTGNAGYCLASIAPSNPGAIMELG